MFALGMKEALVLIVFPAAMVSITVLMCAKCWTKKESRKERSECSTHEDIGNIDIIECPTIGRNSEDFSVSLRKDSAKSSTSAGQLSESSAPIHPGPKGCPKTPLFVECPPRSSSRPVTVFSEQAEATWTVDQPETQFDMDSSPVDVCSNLSAEYRMSVGCDLSLTSSIDESYLQTVNSDNRSSSGYVGLENISV